MRITIKKVGKNWEVNGKKPEKLQRVEKQFFDEFLLAIKLGYQMENNTTVTAENYIGQ